MLSDILDSMEFSLAELKQHKAQGYVSLFTVTATLSHTPRRHLINTLNPQPLTLAAPVPAGTNSHPLTHSLLLIPPLYNAHCRWFDPIFFGDYPAIMKEHIGDRLPVFHEEHKAKLKGSADFIGLNYYTASYVKDAPKPAAAEATPMTDSWSTRQSRGTE